MKVAKKSPRRSLGTARRATLTLSGEVYRKIDELRGAQSRSAWVQRLIEREEQHHEREHLAQILREQYTAAVNQETLALNKQFPVHEK
jgi:predicted CopG family antitoxin